MSAEDATAVMDIMAQADGGCRYCAESLYEGFLERWPEHLELAIAAYARHFMGTPKAEEWREDFGPKGAA